MRILYLITRSELGGAQVHLSDLVSAMQPRAEVTVATGDRGFLTERCDSLGVPVHILKSLVQRVSPWKDLRALIETIALIRRLRPDLIHTHTSKAGLIGRIAAALTRTPCVFTAHTWSFAEGIPWLRKATVLPLEYLAGALSQHIITVSESNRALALRWNIGSPKSLVTVWNGVKDTAWRANPGRHTAPRIVMVARFAEQKDHLTLVRAVAGIREPYTLTLVGEGPTRPAIEAEVSKLNIAARVEFAGSRPDVDAILASSDIFVLATNWEGFPLSIIEALRAGLPVVATDVDGVREAIRDGSTGFLTPRQDVRELRNRLRALIVDPGLRERMGTAGRRRFETTFTLKTMLGRTWDVYESALHESGSLKAQPVLRLPYTEIGRW